MAFWPALPTIGPILVGALSGVALASGLFFQVKEIGALEADILTLESIAATNLDTIARLKASHAASVVALTTTTAAALAAETSLSNYKESIRGIHDPADCIDTTLPPALSAHITNLLLGIEARPR